MAQSRMMLQRMLEDILGNDHVYFQPPESIQMAYPCVVYRLNNIERRSANNLPYIVDYEYQLIAMDWNPDSDLPERLLQLPMSRFSTHYTSDNLHHWIINLYW